MDKLRELDGRDLGVDFPRRIEVLRNDHKKEASQYPHCGNEGCENCDLNAAETALFNAMLDVAVKAFKADGPSGLKTVIFNLGSSVAQIVGAAPPFAQVGVTKEFIAGFTRGTKHARELMETAK